MGGLRPEPPRSMPLPRVSSEIDRALARRYASPGSGARRTTSGAAVPRGGRQTPLAARDHRGAARHDLRARAGARKARTPPCACLPPCHSRTGRCSHGRTGNWPGRFSPRFRAWATAPPIAAARRSSPCATARHCGCAPRGSGRRRGRRCRRRRSTGSPPPQDSARLRSRRVPGCRSAPPAGPRSGTCCRRCRAPGRGG